jgi:hypothetical protein
MTNLQNKIWKGTNCPDLEEKQQRKGRGMFNNWEILFFQQTSRRKKAKNRISHSGRTGLIQGWV